MTTHAHQAVFRSQPMQMHAEFKNEAAFLNQIRLPYPLSSSTWTAYFCETITSQPTDWMNILREVFEHYDEIVSCSLNLCFFLGSTVLLRYLMARVQPKIITKLTLTFNLSI